MISSKSARNLAFFFTSVLLLVGYGSSDLNQDKQECADKLVGLATCLPYVSAQAKTPTVDCCSGLKDVISKSKRCLCLLIKYHDDPNLGLTINLTLALNLPTACHTPVNITQCVDLLHLKPNSPEAKVFSGVENGTGKNSTAPVPSASTATGTGSAAKETGTQSKNGADWGKNWILKDVMCGILPLVLIYQFFFIVF
ncbi:hypothetical protein PIB30_014212 [Stylosanthes scabra]|uniref:Bifunctional inhibitor/plant lipid transfer protein/seed storage helical domain-containing protein n=1 Tax=Stylosanthes scabra TaxID=79078 RepID=A0ABU6W9T2_9FABA|nr:hypothetical protein [Stylosanthes scabra]